MTSAALLGNTGPKPLSRSLKKDLLLVASIPCMTAQSLAHYTFKVAKARSLKTANRENGENIILEQLDWGVNKEATLPSILHVMYPFKVSDNWSKMFNLFEASLRLEFCFEKYKLTFPKFLEKRYVRVCSI